MVVGHVRADAVDEHVAAAAGEQRDGVERPSDCVLEQDRRSGVSGGYFGYKMISCICINL